MKHMKSMAILFLSILLVMGCSDFLVEDISDERVNLKSPFDGLETYSNDISFWWDSLQWVDKYELQVVHPSFDSIAFVDVAVTLDGTIYDANLEDGTYEWTVIAKNSAYQAYSDTFSFTILEDSIGAADELILSTPVDGWLSNETGTTFSWNAISGYDGYRWQLASPDFSSPNNIEAEHFTTGNAYTFNVPNGEYMWRVQAQKDNELLNSEERSMTIDTEPPTTPSDLNPANSDTISLPYDFEWNPSFDAVMDSIHISSDSLFASFIIKEETNVGSYEVPSLTPGNFYFWRVKSMDEVDNESSFSTVEKFYVE